MALTDAEKAKVRRYLGFPDVNRLSYSSLEGALDALSTEGEAEVQACLTSLAALDDYLTASWTRLMVKRAEEVELRGYEEVQGLRNEARRLADTLAAILDVEPLRDIFGGAITGLMING